MVSRGTRPANATASNMSNIYIGARMVGQAAAMLWRLPEDFRVEPEARLFVQLLPACIHARQSKRGVEACEMMGARAASRQKAPE